MVEDVKSWRKELHVEVEMWMIQPLSSKVLKEGGLAHFKANTSFGVWADSQGFSGPLDVAYTL